VIKPKYLFIALTFFATIAQGFWVEWLKDEGILLVDFPLIMLFIFGRKKFKQAPYTKAAIIFATLFMLWNHSGFSIAVAPVFFRKAAVTNIRAFLIFLAIIMYVRNKEDLQYVFLGFAIAVSFQASISIHQWLRGPVGLAWFGEKYYGWQASGTFVHPSVFGMYISMLTVLMYRNAVFLRPKFHWIYLFAFLVGIIGLYASFNRSNWLGFSIAMVFVFVVDLVRGSALNRRVRKFIFLILILGTAGAVKYGTTIVERFSDSEESLKGDRSSSRKNLALDAIGIMNDHPWLGTGLNNYREYADEKTAGLQIVHCTYLLIGAELGYPGLILFLIMMACFAWVAFKGMKSKDYFFRNISAALFTAQMAFAVAALPSPDYRILYVKNHIWMIWALTIATAKLDYNYKRLRPAMMRKRMKKPGPQPQRIPIGQRGRRYGKPVMNSHRFRSA
jgi:hypothetical protein